jgi:membrane protein YqaA with SNARE-associated domain
VNTFLNWLNAFALSIGGPGLFVVAFLDSSFLSLPLINDSLVVAMVLQRGTLMPYYVVGATLGSVAGCYTVYVLAERGGAALLRRRVAPGRVEKILAAYRRYGPLALMVAALLPPPAPFKLFVLMAGVANVRPLTFIGSILVARGARYLALGTLTVWYGDQALALMRTRGQEVAFWLAVAIAAVGVGWWTWRRYNSRS